MRAVQVRVIPALPTVPEHFLLIESDACKRRVEMFDEPLGTSLEHRSQAMPLTALRQPAALGRVGSPLFEDRLRRSAR